MNERSAESNVATTHSLAKQSSFFQTTRETSVSNNVVETENGVKSVKSPRSPRLLSHPQAYVAKGQFLIELQNFHSDKYEVNLDTIAPPSTVHTSNNTMMESISNTRLQFSIYIVRSFP